MKNYIIKNLIEIQQQPNAGKIYSSSIYFEELNKIGRLTSRAENKQSYQRELSLDRLNSIAQFIKESIMDGYSVPIFPSPLVLSVDTSDFYLMKILEECKKDNSKKFDEIYENFVNKYFEILNKKQNGENLNDDETSILENEPQSLIHDKKLYIPLIKNSVFIVDGQHRFKGLNRFIEKYPEINSKYNINEKFNFLVTFLVEFDLYQQSRVFTSINFNQTKVNKSLYYDIFGSYYEKKTKISFSHFLVKHFNQSTNFENIVKVLGNGSGTISLAFIVETIIEKLLDDSTGSLYKYYIEYYEDNGNSFKKIPEFLINYFEFIKENFKEYFPDYEEKEIELTPEVKNIYKNKEVLTNINNVKIIKIKYFSSFSYKNFLFKTTGVYGFLSLINNLYAENPNLISLNKVELFSYLSSMLKNIINDKDNIFTNELFLKTAGKGVQNKFYKLLRDNLNV